MAIVFAGAQPLCARIVSVRGDQVNIRQGAGTNTAIIGKTNKDVVFAWKGAVDGWTRIQMANGMDGYIRNDLLDGYEEATVTGGVVRIRRNPSLQGAVLGNVNRGDKLAISDFRNGWYRVQRGRLVGWISSDYVQLGAKVDLSTVPAAGQTSSAAQDTNAGLTESGGLHNFDSASVSAGTPGGLLSGKTITIDPGHGTIADGKPIDPGAQGVVLGIWERDVNLDIALKLKRILESLGASVWMTHMGTTTLDLSGRAALANENGSHLFISIHSNASVNRTLNGHTVFFYGPADSRHGPQRSLRETLANHVQDSLVQYCGRADLGVKEANFVVLREVNCPSILVETAFLSYAEEELLLAQGAFRQRLADAIATGILRYFGVA